MTQARSDRLIERLMQIWDCADMSRVEAVAEVETAFAEAERDHIAIIESTYASYESEAGKAQHWEDMARRLQKKLDLNAEAAETQLAEAQATITALSHEKETCGAFCSHCGWSTLYIFRDEESQARAQEELLAHTQQCDKNPLVAALTVARARITQLSEENEQLKAAQSAREDTQREGASQPLRADD